VERRTSKNTTRITNALYSNISFIERHFSLKTQNVVQQLLYERLMLLRRRSDFSAIHPEMTQLYQVDEPI
jgi:hypothetical protein